MTRPSPDELRHVAVLADLDDDALAWIAARCELIAVDAGATLFEAGAAADAMYFTLDGTLEARRPDAPAAPTFVARAGDTFGVVPFSRMERFTASGRAVTDVRVARFPREAFDALLHAVPSLEPKLVALLTDRVRETTRRDQQVETLSALGRLSAGLAHELNNPAAAARRAAADARRRAADAAAYAAELGALVAPSGAAPREPHAKPHGGAGAFAALDDLRRSVVERRDREARDAPAPADDALDRADREEALADWIRDAAPDRDAWALAAGLADARLTADTLGERLGERLADLAPHALGAALAWLEAELALDASLRVVESATARIGALVGAVKSYTHMDRAQVVEPVDVRAGLDGALTLLAHRLRDRRVTLARDVPDDLPRVAGRTGELNQVWTNLVDNAIDAATAAPNATVTIRAWHDGDHVAIDVADNGGGVPDAIRARIWEPFYTTKDVGHGTGLGLDIVRRIVERQHGGTITLASAPGDTHFTVRLPVAGA